MAGFLLAGIGHKDRAGTNFLVVDSSTWPLRPQLLLSKRCFPLC